MTSHIEIKKLEDYTSQEIKNFDEMHQVLKTYNSKLGAADELPLPNYTRNEISSYSGYRELVIAKESEDLL